MHKHRVAFEEAVMVFSDPLVLIRIRVNRHLWRRDSKRLCRSRVRPNRDAMNLARHFSAGTTKTSRQVPLGTTEVFRCWHISRPYGTHGDDAFRIPALKCRAKLIASLRDAALVLACPHPGGFLIPPALRVVTNSVLVRILPRIPRPHEAR